MPRRMDISSILVLGAGPIRIGRACAFDCSDTQACRALEADGYRVVPVNSNPATAMTDPDVADATYIEPLTPAFVRRIIAKERPGPASDDGRTDRSEFGSFPASARCFVRRFVHRRFSGGDDACVGTLAWRAYAETYGHLLDFGVGRGSDSYWSGL